MLQDCERPSSFPFSHNCVLGSTLFITVAAMNGNSLSSDYREPQGTEAPIHSDYLLQDLATFSKGLVSQKQSPDRQRKLRSRVPRILVFVSKGECWKCPATCTFEVVVQLHALGLPTSVMAVTSQCVCWSFIDLPRSSFVNCSI